MEHIFGIAFFIQRIDKYESQVVYCVKCSIYRHSGTPYQRRHCFIRSHHCL